MNNLHDLVSMSAVNNAAYLVQLASEYARELRWGQYGSGQISGQLAGYIYKWAHHLADKGAEPGDIRQLLEIGMRAGDVR